VINFLQRVFASESTTCDSLEKFKRLLKTIWCNGTTPSCELWCFC